MRLKYKNGGSPDMDVKSLLKALGEDDKRGLNKLLNRVYRENVKSAEEEGYDDLKAEREERRSERKRLNQEYRDEMRSDDLGMEEEESGGGVDKEKLKKILQALAAGGAGFGAMVGIPSLFNLLKKDKPPISGSTIYGSGESPAPRDPFWRRPNQSSGGKNQ